MDMGQHGYESQVLLSTDKSSDEKTASNLDIRKGHRRGDELSVRQRCTWYLLATSIGATIFLLAALAFLFFLWYGSRSNHTWRTIVLQDWTTRAITLTTVAVRVAVSLQSGIATSMLASIVIEGPGVRLVDVPEVSLTRYASNGPHTFILVLLRQAKTRTFTLLLACYIMLTLATQFASTLLLSDIAIVALPTNPIQSSLRFGFALRNHTDPLYDFVGTIKYPERYWTQPPGSQTFGEYGERAEQKDAVDDTGLRIRAFFPYSKQSDRENLHSYVGSASVFDARVVCVRPLFKSLRLDSVDDYHHFISGHVVPEVSIEGLVHNSTGVGFTCSVSPSMTCPPPNQRDANTDTSRQCDDSTYTICKLDISAGGLIPVLDPTNNGTLKHIWHAEGAIFRSETIRSGWSATNPSRRGPTWAVDLGNAYLIMNLTDNISAADLNFYNSTHRQPTVLKYHLTGVGPWSSISVAYTQRPPYELPYTFRASLCYDAL